MNPGNVKSVILASNIHIPAQNHLCFVLQSIGN